MIFEDETSSGKVQGRDIVGIVIFEDRDIVMLNYKDKTSLRWSSRTRHCRDRDLRGQAIVGIMIFEDQTSPC